ncbi:MAG: dihydrofolate reductase [Bacteroidales bacterium]|nr:dihydrofolate reductase [Bacteroidales bacterium]
MNNLKQILIYSMALTISCKEPIQKTGESADGFDYLAEQFADLRILRYQVPGFDSLNLNQKKLVYYLSQAALCGRDIVFDQNGKYNLAIRRTLENIYETYSGDRETEDFSNFMVYLKRIWFSNGIYHHYSADKFVPDFSEGYFNSLIENSDKSELPLKHGQSPEDLMHELIPVIFDPGVLPKKVCQDQNKDIVAGSAVNFYEGVSQPQVESFYNEMKNPQDPQPVSYGLNSKIMMKDGMIREVVWKMDGMYGEAIEQILFWLDKAQTVTETAGQAATIQKLIEYYKTGNLSAWDEYNILWVKDQKSLVDFINGFIETYDDPLGLKATWESVVNFRNNEATRRTEILSNHAQWFEDNSPVDDQFKKKEVKGVTAKVITVVQLGGECYPAAPLGINLPNADWIRKDYGSKSVTIENITYAYDQANLKTGFLEEFAADKEEIELARKYGFRAYNINIDLHECLGHGSGQMKPGVASDALKNYHAPVEETRADLFALYYIMDPIMEELGLLPTQDAAKAEYNRYIRNGLITQLVRILPGKDIEQAHMRNRQLIARWCLEKGRENNVIELISRAGKTFCRINDYDRLRLLFGELLREVQRIKSEGDYESAKKLVESYGVKVDKYLHEEVLSRYQKLNLSPYSGFINPELIPVEEEGEILDVEIRYPVDYAAQMMHYSRNYSFLPSYN